MEDFLKDISEKNPVLIGLGEMGHGIHKEIFKKLLYSFNSINGIFLEYPANYQTSINKYLKFGTLDEKITQLIAGAESEGKNMKSTLVAILDFAKKKNIPVVCIDSSKERDAPYVHKSEFGVYFLKSKSRDEDMYLNIMENINQKPGSWVVFAHAAHLDYSLDMRKNDPSLGKRLREKLLDRFLNICMLKVKYIQETKYIFANEQLDFESTKLLKDNDFSYLIKDNKIKGFQAVVIHH